MDELTPTQLQHLRDVLVALIADLERTLDAGADLSDTVQLDQSAMGRVSRGDALQQQAMAQATAGRSRMRLGLARQALAALDDHDYGYCRECGEDIGYARLSVRPEAPFCVPCATKRGQ